jgi:hypothetical protein
VVVAAVALSRNPDVGHVIFQRTIGHREIWWRRFTIKDIPVLSHRQLHFRAFSIKTGAFGANVTCR